ncbi:MAG: Cna B-type protein, partial [Acidobacteriaceae bacterium]|nr:Cna B-type protein [Acidobacteriaceae bacterium]
MKRLVCTFVLFLMAPTVWVLAQTTNGSIQGTVTDPSGAIIDGAHVTGRNMGTGLTITTVTSGAGIYSLANLPPGRYEVTVEGPSL